MRFRFPILSFLVVVTSVLLHSQTNAGPSSAANSASEQSESAAKPGMFYDKQLDLSFNYPVEMCTLDMAAEMESGHKNIFGTSGDADPKHQEAKRCTHPLLDAELPEDKAPQRAATLDGIWVDDSREYKDSRKPQPIFAKIT